MCIVKKRKHDWRGWVVDLLFVGGAAAIALGVGLIYHPAGLIAGGVLALVGAKMASVPPGKE